MASLQFDHWLPKNGQLKGQNMIENLPIINLVHDWCNLNIGLTIKLKSIINFIHIFYEIHNFSIIQLSIYVKIY